ncbi:sensor histidine kinase [Pelagicoccus albus]|uniref:histidine kinase n=1 Tax=Pelagicoccus albus TaxID=415222 RepID=A0A7X1E8N8_9BACT|nr:HAMP domain-containing sensor histidine kinase [Pelagicoccus albus]MBC2606348.1 HAMP domain-containing histidine kinase [Pelagicoccus albus]
MKEEIQAETKVLLPPDRSGLLGVFSLLLVMVSFVGVVVWVSFSVRDEIRSQFMSRDAYVLSLMVENELRKAESEYLLFSFETLSEDQVWASLLESAGANGVFAARLYSVEGSMLKSTIETFDGYEHGKSLALEAFSKNKFVTDLLEDATLDDFGVLNFGDSETFSALAVYLPLRSGMDNTPLGVAAYLLDGRTLEDEFKTLDRRLIRQGATASGVGCLAIILISGFAWSRLLDSKRKLADKSIHLQKANQELAMLARTSALGSVTAHLIHGLKNPLAAVRQVLQAKRQGGVGLDEEDWVDADDAAKRMHQLVQEVVEMLQDASLSSGYDLEEEDLKQELTRRFGPIAETMHIGFEVDCTGRGELESHRASLALLIVSNLVQNALDAVGDGGDVRVSIAFGEVDAVFLVRDNGPGVPEDRRKNLFLPMGSEKSGGTGIGLAISKQLSEQLSARLSYAGSEGQGAVFELVVPLKGKE